MSRSGLFWTDPFVESFHRNFIWSVWHLKFLTVYVRAPCFGTTSLRKKIRALGQAEKGSCDTSGPVQAQPNTNLKVRAAKHYAKHCNLNFVHAASLEILFESINKNWLAAFPVAATIRM
jgi:hypothetical protein